MSFQGVCQVCESAPAERSCDQCGALVCEDHFDRELGICATCAAQMRSADDAQPGDDFDVLR